MGSGREGDRDMLLNGPERGACELSVQWIIEWKLCTDFIIYLEDIQTNDARIKIILSAFIN